MDVGHFVWCDRIMSEDKLTGGCSEHVLCSSPIDALQGGVVVSCQAEGDDPFNSPDQIARFAKAAAMGGRCGYSRTRTR